VGTARNRGAHSMLTMRQSASLKIGGGAKSLHTFLKSGGLFTCKMYYLRNGIKLVRNGVKCDVLNNKIPSASGGFVPRPPIRSIRNGRKQMKLARNVVP